VKRELACGVNAVEALLKQHPERVLQLWVAHERGRVEALARIARDFGIAVQSARPDRLDQITEGAVHQGIVAEFRATEPLNDSALDELVEAAGRNALLLVLDQVQDPHNLGACMRSAAAAGALAVVVPRDRAASLTPAARKAAAGAAETLPLVEVANLARALERLQDLGVWCIGLAGEADAQLHATDLTGPLALVLGGEHEGLRQLTRKRCDALVRIPMPGAAESLNVSVAAGIALFEALRQRGALGK
jgi:23S rRNA (guanosine2251-2'-O)-methyltransferase